MYRFIYTTQLVQQGEKFAQRESRAFYSKNSRQWNYYNF